MSDVKAVDFNKSKLGGSGADVPELCIDEGDGTYSPRRAATIYAWNGTAWVVVRTPNTFKDLSAVAIGTIATVWTPASTKKFRLMGGTISVSAAGNVLFEDNSAGAGNFVFRTPKLAADTPYTFDIPGGKLSAAADQVLKATLSTTGTITGTLWGIEE